MVRPAVGGVRETFGIVVVAATISMALWHASVATDAFFPNGLLRLIVSLAVVAIVFMARRQTLVKQAMYVLAVEAAGGIFAFALIDVPFVIGHQAQIGTFTVAVYERFSERSR